MTRLVEKYRPKSLDEIRGQTEVVESIRRILKRGDLLHLLFLGSPGCGKTSVAECIVKELFGDNWRQYYVELNASDERGIDVVRDTIKRIARIKGRRVLFLDESDNMTNDAQQAMRRIMEKTQDTVFILSGNREWKIIDAIKSRCAIFRFRRLKDEDVLRRLLEVCKAEDIKITKDSREGFMEMVKQSRGDLRTALNTLETLIGADKEITVKNIIALQKPRMAGNALSFAIQGNFDKAREMLEDAYINSQFNTDEIIDELYSTLGVMTESKKNSGELEIRLYSKLAETEKAIRQGGNPLIQLIGFISYAWICPHLSKCPALEKS